MTHVEVEIQSQPQSWLRADRLAREQTTRLPQHGERLAVVGCGTSLFMAQAFAVLRESAGHGETDAFPASEVPRGRAYERVLALTRSGTTTEVLELLDRLRGRVPTVAITADPDTPVVEVADEVVVLDFAEERSIVQTRFATTALTLLRAHLGEDVTAAIDDCARVLRDPLPEGVLEQAQFTFLGRGWTVGLANEAALKMREAALAWTEAYPAMEYRHGPISISDERSLTWMLGEAPAGLAAEVAQTGALWVGSAIDPLADLVRTQRVAVSLAHARGLDPDNPRNLARSIVLDPS